MAQPKRRWSKERTHLRRSTWKLDAKNVIECPHCHEAVESHKVCKNCGYYKKEESVGSYPQLYWSIEIKWS